MCVRGSRKMKIRQEGIFVLFMTRFNVGDDDDVGEKHFFHENWYYDVGIDFQEKRVFKFTFLLFLGHFFSFEFQVFNFLIIEEVFYDFYAKLKL